MAPSPGDQAPRLSVIVPAWNAAASIERSLRSVLEERSVPLECLVIDDGSTDGTSDVVERIRAEDPRVVPIQLAANGGVSNARNIGVGAARGEWLAFHDADDRMLPGGIAALMRATADPSVRAVIGQRIWTDGTRTWLSRRYDTPDIREPGRKSIASNPGLMYYASATGKVFHRSLLDGLMFEGRMLGDQPWTIRALLRAGDGIEVIDDTVFEWWRPAEGAPAAGITATSRASAERASEIARMALLAFRSVAAAVDATFDDAPTRSSIKRVYFERLVRSDLSGQIVKTVERRDPEAPQLLDAVADFLHSVPPSILAHSEPALALLLAPAPQHWLALRPAARSAYWRMVDAVAAADPRTLRRLPVSRSMRPAFALAARRGRAARTAAAAYLSARAVAMALRDRLRGT